MKHFCHLFVSSASQVGHGAHSSFHAAGGLQRLHGDALRPPRAGDQPLSAASPEPLVPGMGGEEGPWGIRGGPGRVGLVPGVCSCPGFFRTSGNFGT